MNRRAFLSALTATPLLAGCQSSEPEPELPTVTPAPVPTVTDTGSVREIPAAHREALDGRTYTTRITFRLTYEDGATGRLTDEFTVGTDERYLYERRRVGPYPGDPANVTIWQDGATGFVRREGENETDVVRSSTGTVLEDTTLSGFLAQLLAGFALPADRTADTQTLRDSRTVVRTLPLPPTVHSARNVDLELVIREAVVRSLRIDCVADRGPDDEPVGVEIAFGVDGVGDPGPTRPEWAQRSR